MHRVADVHDLRRRIDAQDHALDHAHVVFAGAEVGGQSDQTGSGGHKVLSRQNLGLQVLGKYRVPPRKVKPAASSQLKAPSKDSLSRPWSLQLGANSWTSNPFAPLPL